MKAKLKFSSLSAHFLLILCLLATSTSAGCSSMKQANRHASSSASSSADANWTSDGAQLPRAYVAAGMDEAAYVEMLERKAPHELTAEEIAYLRLKAEERQSGHLSVIGAMLAANLLLGVLAGLLVSGAVDTGTSE